jgi:hypothetical protein
MTKVASGDAHDAVITVRMAKDLHESLVSIQERMYRETGFRPSVSDVARKLLRDGVNRERKGVKKP